MKQKLWIMLAAVLLLAALWCGSAMADGTQVTEYNLWIAGVQVTSENKDNIPGVTGGVARFDPATNTLTLTNVTGVTGSSDIGIRTELEDGLTITGKATISGVNTGISTNKKVWFRNADITISSSSTCMHSPYGSGHCYVEEGAVLIFRSIEGKGISNVDVTVNAGIMNVVSKNYAINYLRFRQYSGEFTAYSTDSSTIESSEIIIEGGVFDTECADNEITHYGYSPSIRTSLIYYPNCYLQIPANGSVVPTYYANGQLKHTTVNMGYKHLRIVEGTAPEHYYTVTFDGNGQEINIRPIAVWEGESISMQSDPFVSGYLFSGWFRDAACTQAFDPESTITEDITLYAKWTELPRYTVSFQMNDHGTQIEPQSIAEGEFAKAPANPIDDQYVFDGWYADSALTTLFSFTDTPITENVIIYVKWLKICSVTFVMNGYGAQVPDQTVIEGSTVIRPTDPVDANHEYEFIGWYADAAFTQEFDFTDPIADHTVIYAKWLKFMEISFHPNGGSGTMETIRLLYGSTFTIPNCDYTPPAGSVFDNWGWAGASNRLYPGDQITVLSDSVFIAKWKGPYTVNFQANGGTGAMQSVTVGYGEAYTLPACGFTPPVGKAFSSWNVESADATVQWLWPGYELTVYQNVTLKPNWRVARATFKANGGKGILTPVDMLPDSDGCITLPECSLTPPDGQMFAGWSLGQPGERVPIYGDTDVLAQWTTAHYNVSFDRNGGTDGYMAPFITDGDTFVLPTVGFNAPAGKEFYCWGVPAAVTSYKLYFAGETVQINADTVVEAIWVNETPTTCTVTFDPGDGSGSMVSMTVPYNAPFALPECGFTPPTGCVFSYWNINSGYADAGDEVTITADTTVTALYRTLNQYTVIFDNQWHGTAPDSQTVTEGQCVADPGALSEPGYTFEGWTFSYTVDVGSDYTWVTVPFDFSVPVEYYANLRTSGQNEITIDADWTTRLYAVSLNVSDGGTATVRNASQHPDGWQYNNAIYIDYECDDGWYMGSMTLVPETGESREVWPNEYLQPNFTMPECDVIVEIRFWRPEIESGTCGDLCWTLDSDGTLTISGAGAMWDFTWENEAPWMAWKNQIHSVVIQHGVTSAGNLAFAELGNLTSVSLPATVTRIGSMAFYCCNTLGGITLPNGLTILGDSAFQDTAITAADIPAGVRVIDESAFAGCVNLTSVTLHEGLEEIGDSAFDYCSSLEEITIPQSVTALGSYAFDNCTALRRVSGLEQLGQLPSGLFCECSSLTDVGFLPRVSVIEGDTFARCRSLGNIAIPGTVTRIEDWAFDECDSLTAVYFEGSRAMWDAIQIGNYNDGLQNATIYCKFVLTFETFGGSEIEPQVVNWEECATEPAAPTKVGALFTGWYTDIECTEWYGFSTPVTADITLYAGWNVPSPTGFLKLPAALTAIEEQAFMGVTAQAVIIPNTVTAIDESAFEGSAVLYIYGYPGSAAETFAASHPSWFIFVPIDDDWLASH